MILDYKISTEDWVYLTPLVQSSLNHTAVPSLGNRAPTELFTGSKLLVTWQGPYKVVRADSLSLLVRHLVTGDELDAHPSRLKFYTDSSLDVTENHRWNTSIKDYEVLVSWKGLESVEGSWEPLTSLAK
ncbi:hypothetical protein PHMEG_00016493 [Phytophthora megakarya]|uniref:Chromo domain-containing protein n=1 Tax=Phytophthora megakarya TaxID=4795 RepID=A0A225VZR9_9STRA|nr:hypothetical protein PHMEG_00016493 [Phytophthora megakarya]